MLKKLLSPNDLIFFFPEVKIDSTSVEPDLGRPTIKIGLKLLSNSSIFIKFILWLNFPNMLS